MPVWGRLGVENIPNDGETCAGGCVEEVIEALLTEGRRHCLEFIGASKRLGDAEPIDFLVLGAEVDGYLGLRKSGSREADQSKESLGENRCHIHNGSKNLNSKQKE